MEQWQAAHIAVQARGSAQIATACGEGENDTVCGLRSDGMSNFSLKKLHLFVHHDMKQSLSHYFIYTGHNSYLTGNQLSSDCSEKPIVTALRRGVRVIELDLWPNPSKDNILVLHGRTLTTPVAFEKCIVAIRDNAFVSSEFPVVITFEDHLPATLQAKAAETVHRVLGDILFYPDASEEGFPEFPSPELLKRRIIISTKPPKEYLASQKSEGPEASSLSAVEETKEGEQEEAWGDELPDISEDSSSPEKSLPLSVEPLPESESSDEENKPPEKRDESKVAPEYKRIITIRAGKPRGDSLKDALAGDDAYARRVSLSEPQLSKVVKSHPNIVVSFTNKNILRVYPKGTRIDSSNYNPLKAWAHGAQMVAFNMQGYGRPLWLVHGFFRANGGCGYVKKPEFLTDGDSEGQLTRLASFDPRNPGPIKRTLKVKVYQGQGWLQRFHRTHFDTFSPPDFYTRVGIAGVKADTIMKNTKTKMDNWAPRWEEEFDFPLRVPELALLRVEVHEYDAAGKDDFGGQTCLPVQELKPGIRAVPLFDKKGNELSPVRLLMRFTFLT
ncbi:hypothetical protein L7F22_059239 [Adiantum nelumboides]|nr:hypothetical protein [Adiantum nelumboides]